MCDGLGIRAVAQITGVNRGTVGALVLRMGRGCAVLHDRMMVGLRVNRCELDERWSSRRQEQRRATMRDLAVTGDQYTVVALAASTRAIIAYRTGKRNSNNTLEFIHDLRERVIGIPEISTNGFLPYQSAIRHAFGNRVARGTIVKTYSVTHLAVRDAAPLPAEVIAVERDVVSGVPAQISTSYVERSNLTLRISSKRFARFKVIQGDLFE